MFNSLRLKRVTYNLGNVVETKEDITCAVDNKKLKSRLFKHDNHLLLKSKNDPKPITYVISDMTFFPHLRITTEDNIVFINCIFLDEVTIDRANTVTFTNNEYIINDNKFRYNDRFLVINNTNTVNFIDDNLLNHSIQPYPYNIKVNSNNIKLERTNLSGKNTSHINFNCDDLRITDKSTLSIKTGSIKSKDVLIDYTSEIDSKDRLMVDVSNEIMSLDRISCPRLIFNSILKDNSKEEKTNKVKIKRI